nr:YbgA family protein [Streptococcus didelphis]
MAQELWAQYKYEVLSKSPQNYYKIRNYLKNDLVSLVEVEQLIRSAQALEENRHYVFTAFQHIWGYFKKKASQPEKENFLTKLDAYHNGAAEQSEIINEVRRLLIKYPNSYLENSSILKRA